MDVINFVQKYLLNFTEKKEDIVLLFKVSASSWKEYPVYIGKILWKWITHFQICPHNFGRVLITFPVMVDQFSGSNTEFGDWCSRYVLHWSVDRRFQITVPHDYTLIMNLNHLKSICSSKSNLLSNPLSDRNYFPLLLTLFLAQRKLVQI